MTIAIAIPVIHMRLEVLVDVGIHWTPVDRLLLWALSVEPRTSSQLAEEIDLPPRLVSDIIANMMRFGWIEIAPDRNAFKCTMAGVRALHVPDGLPSLADQQSRNVNLTFEPVEHRYFSSADVWVHRRQAVDAIAKHRTVRWLEISPTLVRLDIITAAAQSALRPDEEFVRVRGDAIEPLKRLLLVTVEGNRIEGLPATAPAMLIDAVLKLAAPGNSGSTLRLRPASEKAALQPVIADVELTEEDVVLEGDRHRALLSTLLRQAHHRVVIHSTFLDASKFPAIVEDLRVAVRNGASIDIVYGANKDKQTRLNNRKAALAIADAVKKDPVLNKRVIVHVATTRSHAKLLLADSGQHDRFVAVVGSCNWLSTPYRRVECSVVLRDARAVAAVTHQLAELCFAAAPKHNLSTDLAALAKQLEKSSSRKGAAAVRLVLGDEHGLAMEVARDGAAEQILVAGDRFGKVAEARTLIPMMVAGDKGVRGRVLYSRKVQPVAAEDMADLTWEAKSRGVELVEVPDKVLHGKVLAWDDDDAVITSLNWSSAGTRADNPWGEIGVHVRLPGIAASIRERLQTAVDETAKAYPSKSYRKAG